MIRKKGMPRGRNFTPDERLIAMKVVMSGGSLEELNTQLSAHQKSMGLSERLVPESSFSMMKNTYSRYLNDDDAIKEHIYHPSPLGKLRSRNLKE